MVLIPREHYTDDKKYIVKRANMNGIKHNPTIFIAKIDFTYSLVCFRKPNIEVYSLNLDIWRVLPLHPGPGTVESCVVADKFI